MSSACSRSLIALLIACVFGSALAVDPLPEGDTGIAARYPDDNEIASDEKVIFHDDFESYGSPSELTGRWNEIFSLSNFRIATEVGNYHGGSKAVQITVPAGSTEVANELRKVLSPKRDSIFIRTYAMFHPENSVVGSSHNGLHASANYCCPGVPADGTNKFGVSLDMFRLDASVANPGEATVYVYHPEQRSEWGDYWYPDGRVIPFDSIPGNFGNDFVPRPDFVPVLGRWYSFELMIQANAPGERDGRIALWVDGSLVADWPNLRLRDVSTLKLDQFSIGMHANATRSKSLRKYYDDVVVATSYIGPMSSDDVARPRPPTDFRVTPN
jgi:hypothetical protein